MSIDLEGVDRRIDRSRVVEDWRCPRARWWKYEAEGSGIVANTTSLYLWMGAVLHEALAEIALSHPKVEIDQIAAGGRDQLIDSMIPDAGAATDEDRTFAAEQGALVEGLIRGFYRSAWPGLIAGRKVMMAEEEAQLRNGRFLFQSKPDLILEDLDSGEWIYVEYKSTSSKRAEWIESWATAVQLQSSIKAVEAAFGRAPSQVIVQGLYKGYQSYGRQQSPFCYGYVQPGQPPFRPEQVRYSWERGFTRTPTWEMAGGVKRWVEGMDDQTLADQFPQSPPIFVRERLIGEFLGQMWAREEEIADAIDTLKDDIPDEQRQRIMLQVFPQHFDQCRPAYGSGCEFRRICHGNVTSPLEEGFVRRQPHHAGEAEMLGLPEGF